MNIHSLSLVSVCGKNAAAGAGFGASLCPVLLSCSVLSCQNESCSKSWLQQPQCGRLALKCLGWKFSSRTWHVEATSQRYLTGFFSILAGVKYSVQECFKEAGKSERQENPSPLSVYLNPKKVGFPAPTPRRLGLPFAENFRFFDFGSKSELNQNVSISKSSMKYYYLFLHRSLTSLSVANKLSVWPHFG